MLICSKLYQLVQNSSFNQGQRAILEWFSSHMPDHKAINPSEKKYTFAAAFP
jgi:GTP-dependent phosphoenolpyruvate carboxykinase